MKETIQYLQYSLNCKVFLFDFRKKASKPEEITQCETNMKVHDFETVHIVIFSKQEVYLVMSGNQVEYAGIRV